MKFTTSDLGTILRTELASASKTSVAVAFFNPDQTTLTALREAPNLRLVISDDFHINDPNKLEELHSRSKLRVIPSDARSGKLHSKVFLIQRNDGTR